ncbi:hypothetical protein E3P92_01848 [Wallemia ichthyophaga]|uniref:NmrA-like domain-containing protein n=2 Tax=Wallemia ichthyophaga TaxID=245174 RepID=A0A4T0K347_WALIC|nr:Isoflavone reductase-like protein P3 [Wallemia ichthyophaga EXF-994]TIA73052.1 hypothetical protein E3P91_01671 [Wallemia ichthyophaga]EOR01049.1 Isoflavone reductase-like protein P3 [Wallemia ichthyophaga EXF-994]TIA83844.1 hypothetical protein E3P98_00507 [Wallemia ichthyophaga]TIA94153.1 hypothetical protein E3P97_00435 [Wallemia ichthyophaga]TIB04267.1 hypothetical protein E3P96_01640 [Wallemia ichthyophaga]
MTISNSTVLIIGPTGFVGQRIFNKLLIAKENGKLGRVVAGVNRPTTIANADETIHLDYNDEQNLMQQLQGIDVVVSAVSITPETSASADKLLAAMASTNVKLYIPSEFGVDYHKTQFNKISVFEAKQRHREHARQFDFKTVSLYNGIIMEFTFGKLFDMKQLEWKVLSSKERVAVTSLNDLSSVVALLAATPFEHIGALKDEIYICSDCKTIHDYAKIFEEKTKQPVVLVDQKRDEYLEKYEQFKSGKIQGDPTDAFKATMHLIASEGSIDFSVHNDDKMFDVPWTSVEQYAASICHD